MNATFKRWVTRLVILSLINPAFMVPSAFARDTDIYSGFQTTLASSVKPNVLLVLDTSDSMNAPEGWKEYKGDYDSHVEYLWADTGIIRTSPTVPQYAEHPSRIALGLIPIASLSASGTAATVTTSVAHGYSSG